MSSPQLPAPSSDVPFPYSGANYFFTLFFFFFKCSLNHMPVSNESFLVLLLTPISSGSYPFTSPVLLEFHRDLSTLAFKYFPSQFAFYHRISLLKLLLSPLRQLWWSSSLPD